MNKKPLSKLTANLFGIGNVGFGLLSSFAMYMGTYFWTDVARLPVSLIAVIGMVYSISDLILSPFYGVIISKLPEMRWGRIHSWLLVMPPIVTVCCFFEFSCFTDNVWVRGAIICVGGALAHIFWTMLSTADIAMLGPCSSSGAERARLSARKAQFGTISQLLYSVGVTSVLALCVKIAGGEAGGYQLNYMLYALIFCLAYFAQFTVTKGYEPTKAERAAAGAGGEGIQLQKKQGVTIKAMVIGFVKNPPLLLLMCNDIAMKIINFVINSMIVYYYNVVAQAPNLYSVHLTMFNVLALVGAWFAPKIVKKLGNKGMFQVAWIGCIAGLIGARIFAFQTYPFMVCMAVYGLFQGARNSINHATYGDTAVYAEALTGEDTKAFVYSLTSIPTKVAAFFKTIVVAGVLAASGYEAGVEPTLAMQNGIISSLVTIPLICSAIGLVIMTFYPLNQKKLAQCQEAIDRRKVSQ